MRKTYNSVFAVLKYIYQINAIARWWLLLLGIVLILLASFLSRKTEEFYNETPVQVTYTYEQNIEETVKATNSILSTSIKPSSPFWESAAKVVRTITEIMAILVLLPFLLIYLASIIIQYIIENIPDFLKLIAIIIISIILVCCAGYSFQEAFQTASTMVATPIPSTSLTPTPVVLTKPTFSSTLSGQKVHYISVEVRAPSYLVKGQSQVVELKLAILDELKEKEMPIPLFPSAIYIQ